MTEVDATVEEIIRACRSMAGLPCDGEPVDQLEHALQCAALARHQPRDDPDRPGIAHRIAYEVWANWKLVWENNRECWHCHVGHPQYVQANFWQLPGEQHWVLCERNQAGVRDSAHIPGPYSPSRESTCRPSSTGTSPA